jgi:hypothetical protein
LWSVKSTYGSREEEDIGVGVDVEVVVEVDVELELSPDLEVEEELEFEGLREVGVEFGGILAKKMSSGELLLWFSWRWWERV